MNGNQKEMAPTEDLQ